MSCLRMLCYFHFTFACYFASFVFKRFINALACVSIPKSHTCKILNLKCLDLVKGIKGGSKKQRWCEKDTVAVKISIESKGNYVQKKEAHKVQMETQGMSHLESGGKLCFKDLFASLFVYSGLYFTLFYKNVGLFVFLQREVVERAPTRSEFTQGRKDGLYAKLYDLTLKGTQIKQVIS